MNKDRKEYIGTDLNLHLRLKKGRGKTKKLGIGLIFNFGDV